MFSQSTDTSSISWKKQLEQNPLFNTLQEKGFTKNQIFSMVEERCKQRVSTLTSNSSTRNTPFISQQFTNESNMRRDMSQKNELDITYQRFERESNMRKESHPLNYQGQYNDDSTSERFANESNLRRESHRPHHQTMLATPVQFQNVPHKSKMEDTFQNAFQERQAVHISHASAAPPPPPPSRAHLIPVSSKLLPNVNDFEAMERKKHEVELARRREYEKQTRIRRENYQREINHLKNNMNESYTLLNVPKNYTQKILSHQYRKAALQYHPDRQISKSKQERDYAKVMFEKITKAYMTLLEQLKKNSGNQVFYDLKKQSENTISEQNTVTTPSRPSEKFNLKQFNKIYDDNRLSEPTDEGYGQWLSSEDTSNEPQLNPFSDKFNLNVFNATFDTFKNNDPEVQKQLIKRATDPDTFMGYGQQAFEIGVQNISDYSGEAGLLGYTDLKHAHTTRMIPANSVNVPQTSIDELEKQRENLSYTMDVAELSKRERYKAEEQQLETARLENVHARDQLIMEQHARVNSLLLKK